MKKLLSDLCSEIVFLIYDNIIYSGNLYVRKKRESQIRVDEKNIFIKFFYKST